jgi:hypothetical protein
MDRWVRRAEWLVGAATLVGVTGGFVAVVGKSDLGRCPKAALEKNVNRPGGHVYQHFDSPDARVCADACVSDTRCQAFSFDVTTSRCWLKSDVPPKVENAGFVSGVKRSS